LGGGFWVSKKEKLQEEVHTNGGGVGLFTDRGPQKTKPRKKGGAGF